MRRSQNVASTSAVELDAALPFTIFRGFIAISQCKIPAELKLQFHYTGYGIRKLFLHEFLSSEFALERVARRSTYR